MNLGFNFRPAARWLIKLVAIVVATIAVLAVAVCSCGCSAAQQHMTPPPPATQPAAPGHQTQQSGQGNIAAPGWTGIDYDTAVPIGQVALVALILLLSHKREMARLKERSKNGSRVS